MREPATAGGRWRRLWVHCVGSPLPALERHAERALALARADDVVCVPRPIDPEFLGYLAALGLGPAAANVVVAPPAGGSAVRPLADRLVEADAPARLARRMGPGPFVIDPYAGTAEVFALAGALERAVGRPVPVAAAPPHVTAHAGRHDLARARAIELGIPVPAGEVATLPPHGRRRRDLEPLRAAIDRWRRCTGRVVLRTAAPVPGGSRYVVGDGAEDVDEVLRRVALRSDARAYLVEVLAETTVCATVHLRVEPGGQAVRRLGVSDRRLGRGLTAVGSRQPTAARTIDSMHSWADALGEWLRDLGYAGPAGIDFAEYRDPASGRPGAQFTGLTLRAGEGGYALGIARAVSAAAFVSGVATTRAPGFGRVREALGGLLFDPDRGAGVIPYATGCLDHGRCPMVAVAADRLRASELLGTAQAALETEAGASPRR